MGTKYFKKERDKYRSMEARTLSMTSLSQIFLLETKNRVTIWSSNFTPGHISGKDENSNSKRYMHPNVHSSTVYNSQNMETT